MHEDHDYGRYTNKDRLKPADNLDNLDSAPYDESNGFRRMDEMDEETAAELTADDFDRTANFDDSDDDSVSGVTFGWIGLALSVLSFFWLPIILGGAGIIVGFVARSRDANTLGNIAIIAGAVSIVIRLFVIPFV